MAVIVSNGATTLATASGFYRAESYNLSMFSTTLLALSSTRTIAVTFANAGNAQGLIIPLAANTHVTRPVTVKLQELVAAVWTDRASKTLTAAEISNSTANTSQATWITPFQFGTPYAVNTTAGIWRFEITQGAGSNNWNLMTSNGTAPAYVAWCDNAVSYASGDVPIAKEKITIDSNCTFTGLLSTGDTTNSICAIACRSTTPTVGNDAMFEWENAPAASYTMNINGFFVLSAHSGFRAGTSSSRIPTAQQAIIDIKNATSGTSTFSGFCCGGVSGNNAAYFGRMSLNIFGEIPAVTRTTLASDAATAQQDIVTTDATGWTVGDSICITKGAAAGAMAETVPFTIDTIAGTAINVNTNILTATRKAGGHVFRLNGYGVVLKSSFASSLVNNYLYGLNAMRLSGVQLQSVSFTSSGGTSQWYDEAANIDVIKVDNCSYYTVNGSGTLLAATNFSSTASAGVEISNVNSFKGALTQTFYGPSRYNSLLIEDCVLYGSAGSILGLTRNRGVVIQDNFFYNIYNAQAIGVTSGLASSTIQRNVFWGAIYGMRVDGAVVDLDWNNNVVDYCTNVFWVFSTILNSVVANDSYGLNGAVTYVAVPFAAYNSYWGLVFRDCNIGTITRFIDDMTQSVDGSMIGIQNYDLTTNDDQCWMTYGVIQRTGTGLSDTTVRTSGGYAMRFTPTSSTYLMHWEQTIPTGDIDTKTMTISVWVYINNAAYYAGTHTKPTLTVTYDNGTEISAVATATAGAWQQLAVTFTPTTSFGQVEMRITAATDATGTNRYFYVDDVNIAYPAGVAVDLGNLDLWADGLPVAPAIATVPSLGGVWDEPLTAHTIAGSMGVLLSDAADNAELAAIK